MLLQTYIEYLRGLLEEERTVNHHGRERQLDMVTDMENIVGSFTFIYTKNLKIKTLQIVGKTLAFIFLRNIFTCHRIFSMSAWTMSSMWSRKLVKSIDDCV